MPPSINTKILFIDSYFLYTYVHYDCTMQVFIWTIEEFNFAVILSSPDI